METSNEKLKCVRFQVSGVVESALCIPVFFCELSNHFVKSLSLTSLFNHKNAYKNTDSNTKIKLIHNKDAKVCLQSIDYTLP